MQQHVHCNDKDNNTVDNNLGLHKIILLRVSKCFTNIGSSIFWIPIMQGTAGDREREGVKCIWSVYTLEMGNQGPDKGSDFPWVTQNQKQTWKHAPSFWVRSLLLRTQAHPSSPIYSTKFMTWHYPGTLGCQFPLQFYKISFGRRKKFMLVH